jgi:N-acyl-L-homoserine lactone synthetase
MSVPDTLLAGIQRLRYKVYCGELGFLDTAACPDGYESDQYDAVSIQIAARNSSGDLVGTLRLVLDSPLGFPFEAHASRLSPDFYSMPRAKTAEISRLIVDQGHRGLKAGSVRQLQPVLMILFRSMYELTIDLGLEYWLGAMEPTLHRTLRHLLGFSFSSIGPPMDYHGEVVPYGVSVRYVEDTMARRRPDNFYFFGMDRVRAFDPPEGWNSSRESSVMAAAYHHQVASAGLEPVMIT